MTRETNAAVPPSTKAFINLSNYMYYAYNTPYSQTTLQTNIQYVPLTTKKGTPITSIIDSAGLYAEAFASVNSAGKITKGSDIVVAYEGTNLLNQSNTFTGGQLRDDADIAAGTLAPSFRPAAAFAKRVINYSSALGIKKSHVFVTGHSLGAAEAEYAARATGLGGQVFAPPGIAGKAKAPANLTDYVEAGDPIGSYAQDSTWGAAVSLSSNINHYGTVTSVNPSSTAASVLTMSGQNYAMATGAEGKGLILANGLLQTLQSEKITITTGFGPFTIQGLGDYHSLTQYASDLHTPLYIPDGTATGDTSFFPSAGVSDVPPTSTTASAVSAVQCFVTGTNIRTTRGDCAVEDLVVGDVVVTAGGETRPIVWIGHRDTDCHARPDLHPVRVSAHAFGTDLPARDLTLSSGHPVLVGADENNEGGWLVPIMCLVNGTTIERVRVESVTYWHVELDQHDILLAEGLPAESYIDLGSRPWFAGEDGAIYDPDLTLPGLPGRCRPVEIHSSVIEEERRRLDMVFATRLARACVWPHEAYDVALDG